MPELPEVETIVRNYRPRLEGREITRFVCRVAKQAEPSVPAVRRAIVGKRISRLWRRAKYIVADLERVAPRALSTPEPAGHLFMHLRMSGGLDWAGSHEREPDHVRAYFDLDDGNRLLFCDSRKFGRITFVRDADAITRQLGVEPLEREFTTAVLKTLLHSRARQLKPLLLDQSVVAGLGNIYTDEVLYRAGLHPMGRSDRVTDKQIARLRAAIRGILGMGIRHCGTSLDGVYRGGGMRRYLRVYGRAGLPCRRCGTPVQALRVAERATHICPCCQPYDRKR
jgi:formamidopyrimidine-DNA glycosylase